MQLGCSHHYALIIPRCSIYMSPLLHPWLASIPCRVPPVSAALSSCRQRIPLLPAARELFAAVDSPDTATVVMPLSASPRTAWSVGPQTPPAAAGSPDASSSAGAGAGAVKLSDAGSYRPWRPSPPAGWCKRPGIWRPVGKKRARVRCGNGGKSASQAAHVSLSK